MNSSKMCKCKAGVQFIACVSVFMHAFFVQSYLVSVYTHLTGASTNCVDDGESRHYNTWKDFFFFFAIILLPDIRTGV